jgi:hypothetical protein
VTGGVVKELGEEESGVEAGGISSTDIVGVRLWRGQNGKVQRVAKATTVPFRSLQPHFEPDMRMDGAESGAH